MSSAEPQRRAAALVWILALVAVLAPAAPAGAREAAAAGKCRGTEAPAGSIGTEKAERALLCLVNRIRAKRDLPTLHRRNDLDAPARAPSAVMVDAGCLKHRCPGEERLGERLSEYLAAGGQGYGENIASGVGRSGSADTVLRAWMKDEGNRRNVLDPDFEHVGVGVARGTPTNPRGDGATYTADFGYFSG